MNPDQMTKAHDPLKADMQRLSARYHTTRDQPYKHSFATTQRLDSEREYWRPKSKARLESKATKKDAATYEKLGGYKLQLVEEVIANGETKQTMS